MKNCYGNSFEVDSFGHGGVDGPAVSDEVSRFSLTDVTGNRGLLGSKKMIPSLLV